MSNPDNVIVYKTTGVGPSELYLLSIYYYRDEFDRAVWIAAHNSELAANYADSRDDWKSQGLVYSDIQVREWGAQTNADIFSHGVDVILRPGHPPAFDPKGVIKPHGKAVPNDRPDGVEGPLEEGYCQRCGVYECLEHPRGATLLQELAIEAAGVLHRRGQLYRVARERIIDLQEALEDCVTQMEQCEKMFQDDSDFIEALEGARDVLAIEPNNN